MLPHVSWGVSGSQGHISLYREDCGSLHVSYAVLSAHLTASLEESYYYLCLTEEETEGQRVGTTCPGSHAVAITSVSPPLGESQEPLSLIHS